MRRVSMGMLLSVFRAFRWLAQRVLRLAGLRIGELFWMGLFGENEPVGSGHPQ